MSMTQTLLDLEPSEIGSLLSDLGEPAYRGKQIFSWIHKRGARGYSEMSDLPLSLRSRLEEVLPLGFPEEETRKEGRHAVKILLRLRDGSAVECVRLSSDQGFTACVSSQTGCVMACRFCATGKVRPARNLTPGEIVAQVYCLNEPGKMIDHVVFMGMGEPFLNYENVHAAIRLLNDPQGLNLGARRLTVSTAGMVPEIYRFAEEDTQVNLAVSLNAPSQDLRESLMPLARYYPLDRLLKACRHYVEKTHRRLSFEYLLLRGRNDSVEHANALADLVRGERFHVNLIVYNPVGVPGLSESDARAVEAFKRRLIQRKVTVTVRRSPGCEIHAACGQLAGHADSRG